MKESAEKNWREWSKDTTDRQGRERDLEEYEGYLGFSREDLRGKKVLDIGSGETELFSRQMKKEIPDAEVISLNPDYAEGRYRKTVSRKEDWQKKSVAGIGQELPFEDKSFDEVFGLFSLTVFSDPHPKHGNPEAAKRWFQEIARVLKSGGEARLAPISAETAQEVFEGKYKELIEMARVMGLEVTIEKIKNKDIGLEYSLVGRVDEKGQMKHEKEYYPDESFMTRFILRKSPK